MPAFGRPGPSRPPAESGIRRDLAVVLEGDSPVKSSPLITLRDALARHRIRATFGAEATSHVDWLRKVRSSDAVIIMNFGGLGAGQLARLMLAALMGRPLVRWWVGSDVLDCLKFGAEGRFAATLDRLVALNVAVAPHLVEELSSLGIGSVFVPSVLDFEKVPATAADDGGPMPRGVLVYLPARADNFYGEHVARRLFSANPDLEFFVIGCQDGGRFAPYPNVRNLGWVDGIGSLYPKIGCLLRITEHDGLPRMVLESLLMGRYVIYSWPMPGCWRATDFGQAYEALRRFRDADGPNVAGRAEARRLLQPDPAGRFADLIAEVASRRWSWTRLAPLGRPLLLLTSMILGRFRGKIGSRRLGRPRAISLPAAPPR